MNYYERHLGDYAKDTGHLSMLEHGAYTLLLDRYYATESGIPDDQKYRVARARAKDEKDAVDAVLSEFFSLVDGLWIKSRCQEEIEKAQRRIHAARSNGVSGGRPKKIPKQPQEKPSGLSPGSDSETQSKALHLPSTIYQEERDSERALDSIPSEPDRQTEPPTEIDPTLRRCGEFATVLREEGMSKVTSMHPDLTRWVQDGFTLAKCRDALHRAKLTLGKNDGISAAYVDKILRDNGKQEARPVVRNRVVV